jgi:hypothetical protein
MEASSKTGSFKSNTMMARFECAMRTRASRWLRGRG